MILLKSLYHTLKIRCRLAAAGLFYVEANQFEFAQNKLSDRHFSWNKGETKVFAIFHINNWEDVLIKHLKDIGETRHFSWKGGENFFESKKKWEEYSNLLNKRLMSEFDKFYEENTNILVFIYASDFSISTESLFYLKRRNVLIVSFCWDDLLYFHGQVKGQPVGVKKISHSADVNLTMSPEAFPFYSLNQSPIFFWKSINVELIENAYANKSLVSNDFYVLFIGSKYGWRGTFIEKIKKSGINVKCFGAGWGTGSLSHEEMIREIQRAPLTLGFSNVGYTKNITTIKGRDFEVPLWGGLYLTQSSAGLEFYYTPNEDVLVYKNFTECLSQINFAKDNFEAVKQIRMRGHEKALRKATWESRFKYLKFLLDEVIIRTDDDHQT